MSIFKSYDIRGIYPAELNEKTAYKIGRALASVFKPKKVAVGRDMRLSGKKISKALIKGITDSGADVVDIGLTGTPMFYFAVGFYKYDLGIMVTASHNPPAYNGFKVCKKNVFPVGYDNGLNKVEKLLNKKFPLNKKGKATKKNVLGDYKKYLLKGIRKFNFKVVADAANGMGTNEAVLLKPICKLVPLFFGLDGTFPNHEPDPLKHENLRWLIKEVKKQKADFGMAFDGDADRVGFVDDKGDVISGDIITALISKLYKNKKILYDLRSSKITPETINKNNRAIISRVGHTHIKKTMKDKGIVFAGELSGHYYFKETYNAESSVLATVKLMQVLEKEKKKLSELAEQLKKYSHSGEINFMVKDKDKKLKEIEKHYKNARISRIDGLTVEFKDFWFNLRKSNTEPLLRLNLEANNKTLMQEKVRELKKLIEK